MADFTVTPWEVKGKVDYDKLIEKFGTSRVDASLLERLERLTGDLHLLFRRGIIFSHRDFDLALADYERKKPIFLYTGRGPSGKMHIGHIMPFYFTKWLQDKFNANLYIQITDDEKYYFKDKSLEEIEKLAADNIAEIAAVGFDPDKTFIFKDSEYIKNMYGLVMRISKKITFSTVKDVFGFNNASNIGMIQFPAMEIAPTMFEKARCLIPASIDQDPYWRVQRDIAESLGYYKAAAVHMKLLMPLTGPDGKMSSSDPSTAIFLDDDEKTVRNKIMKYAFSGGQATAELQRKLGGNPDIDVAFQLLYYLLEEDDKKIDEIRNEYKSGRLLTGELKEMAADKLIEFLRRHNERKANAGKHIEQFMYTGRLAKEMWNTIYE